MVTKLLDRETLTTNLRTALATATNRPIGNHDSPGGDSPSYPYAVLYAIPGGAMDSQTLDDPFADAYLVYQATSVGRTPWTVENLADKIRRAFLLQNDDGSFVTAFPAPAGYKVAFRSLDGGPGGVEPQGNSIYNLAERYVLWLTPA